MRIWITTWIVVNGGSYLIVGEWLLTPGEAIILVSIALLFAEMPAWMRVKGGDE